MSTTCVRALRLEASRRSARPGMAAAAAALIGLAGHALGQNALGDGTNLHANPAVGSGGRNLPTRDFGAEMRFRNAMVTGNTPNGISFRGDLPYFAPGDFQSRLPSNELYAFRRDSLNSGLGGMGIRGTEALQQQFALTTGNRVPDLLSGSLIVNRFGGGMPDFTRMPGPAFDPMRDSLKPAGQSGVLDRIDPMPELTPDFAGLALGDGQALGTLRSTSAYAATRGMQTTLLDVRTTPNQDLIGVSASGLRGIQSIPLGKAGFDGTLAGMKDALSAGSQARPVTPGTGGLLVPDTLMGTPTTSGSVYDQLVGRLDDYAGSGGIGPIPGLNPEQPDTRFPWQKEIDAIRAAFDESEAAAGRAQPPAYPPGVPGGEGFAPTALEPLPPVKNYTFDPSTLAFLRNAPGEVGSYVPESAGTLPDAYTEYMKMGELAMGRARYFDAEEAFTRALSVKSGDAMALIGRAHAQLGAGMNLSAAMNLRALFKEHPEMLSVRYGGDLLPTRPRMREISAQLRTMLQTGASPREASLLLAYVGYQISDGAALADGLKAMDQSKDPSGDALTDLIAAVWSGRESAPEAPPAETPER